jgi:hypothetical protein
MPPISSIKKRSGVASAINRYGRGALNTLKAHSAHVYRGIRGVESLRPPAVRDPASPARVPPARRRLSKPLRR